MSPLTPLQKFLQSNPLLCPDHYRFSDEELGRSCSAFTEANPFYKTTSLFIEIFRDLRKQLSALTVFDYDADFLARDCVELVNHDAIIAFKEHAAQLKPTTSTKPRDLISLLGTRPVTTASGAMLNLNESFPSLADTLQTILDALPYLTRGIDKMDLNGKHDEKLEAELVKFSQLSNAYRITKGDWENALWLNFRLTEDGEVLDQPEGALAVILRANNFRYEDHTFAQHLRRGKKISTGTSAAPIMYEADFSGEEKLPQIRALLRVFGNTRLRRSVTLGDTFRTFLHIRLIADEILTSDVNIQMSLERSARLRASLISELAGKLNLTLGQCADALDILTYKGPRKSNIWTAPDLPLSFSSTRS